MTDKKWLEQARRLLIDQPLRLFFSLLIGGIGLGGGLIPVLGMGPELVLVTATAAGVGFVAARHWALSHHWKTQQREIRKEADTAIEEVSKLVEELRSKLKEQSERTLVYRAALADVVDRYTTPFSEELTIVYHIGSSDSGDFVEQRHKTRALGDGPSDCLLWRTFEESATGYNAGIHRLIRRSLSWPGRTRNLTGWNSYRWRNRRHGSEE